MLHRSFKSAKCKTALKLAVSRIKLLKNKREAQVRQLKRELAQLLESGQDQTARIRVEHVVREEKTMAAYDLIEIYCELIAARLPIIESQKNCPIDLKEAISSVIFASPRCADVPELMDVRKHITAKYGKEFASAAVELRPDCGVNRLLVEKLSAKGPDGPTKIKILAAIAEEHKVKWEPKSFGENDVKPSQDLQIGPNTYEQANYVEPPQVHISHVHDERGPSNLHNYEKAGYVEHTQVHNPIVQDEEGPPNRHASSQHKEMHNAPANSYNHNPSYGAAKVGGNKSTASTTPGRSNQEIRSPGSGNQEMDSRDSYSENRSAFAMGRQNWNLEFQDAASAAQAAAESAELASMAARAAAELSNREKINRQFSSGSQNSSVSGLRDEVPQEYAFHDDKHFSTESVHSTFHNSNPGMHNEHINACEQDNLAGASDHGNVMKPAHLESVASSSSSGLDNPFGSRSQMADIYSRNNSSEQENTDFLHEVSMEKQVSTTEVDFVSEMHDDWNTENNYFGDTQMHRNYSKPPSSQFITPAGDENDVLELSDQQIGNNAVPDLIVTDEGNMWSNFKEKSSYDDSAVVFDDSESDDDDFKFDIDKTHEETGSTLYFSSPARKTQIDPLANRNAWSPGQVFDEKEGGSSSQSHISAIPESFTKSAVSSGEADLLPVTFDDSDGPSSEGEENLLLSNVTGSHDHGNFDTNQTENHGSLRSSSMNNRNVDSDRDMQLSASAVGSETMEGRLERMNITTVSEKKRGCDELATNQPSSGGISSVLGLDVDTNNHQSQSPDTFDNTKTLRETCIQSDKEINYGMLKGGLRNKGYKRPPYVTSQSGTGSSSLGDMSVQNEQSSPRVMNSLSSDARAQDTYLRKASIGNRNPVLRAHNTSSGFDRIPNSKETPPTNQDSHTQKVGSEVNKESSSRVSVTYFNGSDSEDDLSKLNSARLASPVNAFSRRTTASSKTVTGLGWKSSSRVSRESENERKASETKSSDKLASSEVYLETNTAAKPFPQSNSSSHEEIVKSSSRTQVSSSHPKAVIPDSERASKSSNPGGETPSKEKASHVHPKLPDYDSFAAHFLSLRKGRQ